MSDNKIVLVFVIVVLLAVIIAATTFLVGQLETLDVDSESGDDVFLSSSDYEKLSGEDYFVSGEEEVSGEVSSGESEVALPNFEYNLENGTVDLGEDWEKYVFGFSDSGENHEVIYVPSQRILKRVYQSYENFGGDGKTFAANWLTIALASDRSIYKTVYTPKVSNENEEIIELSRITYNIKNGTIDLGENWSEYVYTISNSLQSGTIYKPTQRILRKVTEQGLAGEKFSSDCICVGLNKNRSIYKVIYAENEFPNFEYNAEKRTLDLGENWKNYQFCYDGCSGPGAIYTPSQRILNKVPGSGGGTAQFDCNRLKIMLKENNELYRVVETAEKLPEFTYNTTTGTIDLGEDWQKYKYQCGSNPDSFGNIYFPTQRVLTRVITYEDGENIFNADYIKIGLRSNPSPYFVVLHTPRIIPALKYDRNTKSVDLGSDWEKYEFSYYDSKTSTQIVYKPSQRILNKDVLNEMNGTNGKTFAGDYVNVILRANKMVYQTVYTKD